MTEVQKKWFIVGLTVVAVLLWVIFLITVTLSIRGLIVRNNSIVDQRETQVYLPVVLKQEPVFVHPPTVDNEVDSTVEPQLSDVYRVSLIEESALQRHGYVYDVATFVNVVDESMVLRAQCAEPSWPSPDIGTRYRLNQWGVLIPEVDNENNNLQRFIVLDE